MGRALSTARPTAPGGDVHLLTHLLAGGGGGRHPWPEAARGGAPLPARPTARLAGSGAPTPQAPHEIIAGLAGPGARRGAEEGVRSRPLATAGPTRSGEGGPVSEASGRPGRAGGGVQPHRVLGQELELAGR